MPPAAVAPTTAVPNGNPNAGRLDISGNLLSSGQPPAQPATPAPTILSDANIRDNVVPQNQTKLATYNAPAITPAQSTSDQNSDTPTPDYSSLLGAADNTGSYDPTQDPLYQQEIGLINSQKSGNDAVTAASLDSIKNSYADLLRQQTTANSATQNQQENALLLGGSARYAPISSAGILNAETTSGLQKLSDLTDKENAAIAAANTANQNNDQALLDKQLTLIDGIRQQKQAAAANVAAALSAQKTKNATDVAGIAKSAAENGASPDVLAKINAAPDMASAITAAGDSLQTGTGIVGEYLYYKRQAQAAGQNPVDFNTYQNEDANRKAKAAAAGSPVGGIDTSILDTATQAKLAASPFSKYNGSTQSLAVQLVTGNLAPTDLSKRSTGDSPYNDVLNAADAYSMATTGKHFDIAQAGRDYKFANNAATQNTLNYFKSLVGTADGNGNLSGGNLDELKSASDAVTRTSFPALNDAAAWARETAGDPTISNYQVVVTEVADQIAKILQGGGTGSGTSDAKLQQAQNMFNSGFSKDQINGIISTVEPLLVNRAKAMVGDNPYLSDYADDFGFSQNTAPDASAPNTGDSLVQDDAQAQTTVQGIAKNNPKVAKTVYDLLSTPDPTLGRVMTYSEIYQYLQATGLAQ